MKQKRHISSKKRQTVPLTLWVRPEIKAEIQRRSDLEGPSMSKIGGELLAAQLRQDLHAQHSVLLQPIIENTIDRKMDKRDKRFAKLLVHAVYVLEQLRGINTNILGRQPGVTSEVLDTIIDRSHKTAQANITRKTPQLETILEKWFTEE